MRNSTKIILILLGGAFLVALHHYIISGKWYDWADIENHETIIIILLAIAGTTYYLQRVEGKLGFADKRPGA